MASLSFVSGPRNDASFNIGLGVVILFAVAEIGAVGIHLIARSRPATTAVTAPPREVTAPAPLPSVAPSAPPVALAVASPSAALTPATSTISVADRLMKEAT